MTSDNMLSECSQARTILDDNLEVAKIKFQTESRLLAEKYFKELIKQLTSSDYQKLVCTDKLFNFLERDLDRNDLTYDIDHPSDKHLQIGCYAKTFICDNAGTLYERYPAIKKQMGEIFRINPESKFLIQNNVYRDISNSQHYMLAKEIQKPFLDCLDDFDATPLRERTICAILRETDFESIPNKGYKGFTENSLRIIFNDKILFPNEEFVAKIQEISKWYKKCFDVGFNPYSIIIQKDARIARKVESDWES